MTLQKFIDTVGMMLAILTIPFDAALTLICGILSALLIVFCIIWAFFGKVPFDKIKDTFIYRHSFGIKDLNEFLFLATKVANRIYY